MLKANGETIAENRRARFDYVIETTLEAGLILEGSEVKSLRLGHASIAEAHAAEKQGKLYLFNATINEYPGANRFNHAPKRPRLLLLKAREIRKLIAGIQRQGVTLVPLSLYFNKQGYVKVKIGLAKGKKKVDKREAIKERDWQRHKARALKDA